MDEAAVHAIERPSPKLMTLYVLQALFSLILFPIVIVPLYFRYHTLRYRFDDEGVSAKWGILFRREVYVTYRRIQDIHVTRNLFERWLGIGKVEIQTASGSSSAELTIEGMVEYEAVRDHLYARMRGATSGAARGAAPAAHPAAVHAPGTAAAAVGEEALLLLREIRDDVQAARRALESRGGA
jgi:putative membrane protein